DLMFAIPGQTIEQWRDTLIEAVAMRSEHLSTYEVIYEEDTPLYAQLQAGEFDVDEDLACVMYEELLSPGNDAGFERYEIANFARAEPGPRSVALPGDSATFADAPSKACQHNINYWRGSYFYGLGPSATSYVRGVRTKNWSNTPFYCEQLEQRKRP